MTDPVRLALHAGIVVRHDAISTGLRLKLDVLRAMRSAGVPVAVTVFTGATDFDDPELEVVHSPHRLLASAAFREADMHIFEFGIRYPLFNCIFAVPRGRSTAVVYHNVTPPHLADTPEARSALELSEVQRYNLFAADAVACVGEFSRRELLELGIAEDRLSVLPLPPSVRCAPGSSRPAGPVRFLFVGRLVRAKGILDLVEAVGRLHAEGGKSVELVIAGNAAFSAEPFLEAIHAAVARAGMADAVRMVRSPDDEELVRLYAGSDVVVMPSYHEGYCLPVLEALACHRPVVSYDAGNLPFIGGGLTRTVPTGDVAALSAALSDAAGRVRAATLDGAGLVVATQGGEMPYEAWCSAADAHVERHSRVAFERSFAALLARLSTAAGERGARLREALLAWSPSPVHV